MGYQSDMSCQCHACTTWLVKVNVGCILAEVHDTHYTSMQMAHQPVEAAMFNYENIQHFCPVFSFLFKQLKLPSYLQDDQSPKNSTVQQQSILSPVRCAFLASSLSQKKHLLTDEDLGTCSEFTVEAIFMVGNPFVQFQSRDTGEKLHAGESGS